MRDRITLTQSFQNLDTLRQKTYSRKANVDRISHFYYVAFLRDVDFMISTQSPNKIELNIVKELIKNNE